MNSQQRRKARRAQERTAKSLPAPAIDLRAAVAEIQQRVAVLALPAPKPIVSDTEWCAFGPGEFVPLLGLVTAMAKRSSNGYVYDRKPAYQAVAA